MKKTSHIRQNYCNLHVSSRVDAGMRYIVADRPSRFNKIVGGIVTLLQSTRRRQRAHCCQNLVSLRKHLLVLPLQESTTKLCSHRHPLPASTGSRGPVLTSPLFFLHRDHHRGQQPIMLDGTRQAMRKSLDFVGKKYNKRERRRRCDSKKVM